MKSFPFYRQLNAMDCGPACLKMVAIFYGKNLNIDSIRQQMGFSKTGVTLLGISKTAEFIGFRTRGVKITYAQLTDIPLPCILHWNQNHFVVLIAVSRKKVRVADPGKGIITYTKNEFLAHWSPSPGLTPALSGGEGVGEDPGISPSLEERAGVRPEERFGIALLLEPTPLFYESDGEKEHKLSWRLVLQYLAQSKGQIAQVFIALIITSLLQLIVPFLTQNIVDTGINMQNLQFVVIMLAAQLMLTFSQTIVSFIQNRLLLRISNILNIQILSDFWIKLTRLPVSYFDVHHTGDTLQRIGDHRTIQNFLTGTALNTLFSVFTFVVYAVVLMTQRK